MGRLQGKVALVTGAGQGVGQGIAYALAAEGAAVAVTGRTASKLDDTVAGIRERGGKGHQGKADRKGHRGSFHGREAPQCGGALNRY